MVKSESFWNIFMTNLTCIYGRIKWSEKRLNNYVIWVCNATIEFWLMFSDHQRYYKVLCYHIMVRSGPFSNIFHYELYMYILIKKLSRKSWRNNVIRVCNVTIQLCLMFSDQQQYYKVLCDHLMVRLEYFCNILHNHLQMYIYLWINWAKKICKIISFVFVMPQ